MPLPHLRCRAMHPPSKGPGPGSPAVLLQEGLQAHQAGRLDAAAAAFAASLAQQPRQAQVWGQLGEVKEALGLIAEAEACFRRAVEIRPDFAAAQYNRARLLRQLADPEAATCCLALALQAPAGGTTLRAQMLRLLALLQDEAGHLEMAVRTLEKALTVAPGRAALHHNRRAFLQRLTRPVEALAAYRAALALQPQHDLALYDIARLRWRLADPDFTTELDVAAAATPTSAVALGIKGRILVRAKRYEEAALSFKLATECAAGVAGYFDALGNPTRRLRAPWQTHHPGRCGRTAQRHSVRNSPGRQIL